MNFIYNSAYIKHTIVNTTQCNPVYLADVSFFAVSLNLFLCLKSSPITVDHVKIKRNSFLQKKITVFILSDEYIDQIT